MDDRHAQNDDGASGRRNHRLHWGLLPKWSYGGDIAEVECYALFANFCCWRGLVDTAWLLDEFGDEATARRYRDEAAAYRQDIERAMAGSYQAAAAPPFLPLRLYARQPDEQMDYYQLFAGCMLDVEFLGPNDPAYHWITDFLEADNRVFCGLPRFRRDAGRRRARCALRQRLPAGKVAGSSRARIPARVLRLPRVQSGSRDVHVPRDERAVCQRPARAFDVPRSRRVRPRALFERGRPAFPAAHAGHRAVAAEPAPPDTLLLLAGVPAPLVGRRATRVRLRATAHDVWADFGPRALGRHCGPDRGGRGAAHASTAARLAGCGSGTRKRDPSSRSRSTVSRTRNSTSLTNRLRCRPKATRCGWSCSTADWKVNGPTLESTWGLRDGNH